ncbi:hypothetical protein [Gilliamella sp. Pas-s27]|uniref:hypothetical protein n=1 Tax=Gilliamella sp. Pas-s27 TaxID=2687311 RepID=UPI001366432C|nr:hypothetical protein [Gilliamella sp. Pas-s27]MWP47973.1 hypothetical protein [Gilliamella sp. Pas-s27]
MNKIKNKTALNLPVRVELSYLQQIDGLYFLNDVLFSGLAYDHREQTLHKVYQITQGAITAEDDYGFFKHNSSPLKIDFDVIEDEDEDGDYYNYGNDTTYYQGELLNGVTYVYRNGFLWGEALWIDGYDVEDIGWYTDGSGLIYEYETNYVGDKCKVEWNYKQLTNIDIIREQALINLTFNDQNQIKSCALAVDNIADLGNLFKRDDLPLPLNNLKGLLAYYPLAEDIMLNIQREDNFHYFVNHTQFHTIKKLTLSTQYLSLPVLTKLMDLPNLKYIFFEESGVSDFDLETMPEQERKIKQQQCDERNHALLTLLFAIQAKRHCQIRLDSNSGLLFDYCPVNGKVTANVNQNDFNYLLNTLPLEQITVLDLRQRNFPISLFAKIAQFSNLKKLSIKENKKTMDYSHEQSVDKQARIMAYQQREHRNQEIWTFLKSFQLQVHCDIKLISETLQVFELRYQG